MSGGPDLAYAVTPFAAWLVAGATKFLVNSLRAGRPAFGLIGYGGLPSNHAAIVGSVAALVALREGIGHPAFGAAVALAWIVLLDANSLRRQIGRQAAQINRLLAREGAAERLRERIGHTRVELGAGIVVGVAVAAAVHRVFAPVLA